MLTYSSHQTVIKNVKLTFLKWNMILSWAQEAVKRSTCIWNAFGHPPGNREGRGAVSETRADCFYTLFRELFLTLSHRCPTIVKILPAQLRLLKENVGGLALCGDAWKNNHVFLFISVMFSFKIVKIKWVWSGRFNINRQDALWNEVLLTLMFGLELWPHT